jgi:hypothetical protein
VARAFLDVARCVCEASVHRGAAFGRNGVIDRRCKQWMREANDAVRPKRHSTDRNRLIEREISFVYRAR